MSYHLSSSMARTRRSSRLPDHSPGEPTVGTDDDRLAQLGRDLRLLSVYTDPGRQLDRGKDVSSHIAAH